MDDPLIDAHDAHCIFLLLYLTKYRNTFVMAIVISRFQKRYLKAKRTSLFRSAATNQGGFKGVKRSSGSISRIPEGDRIAYSC